MNPTNEFIMKIRFEEHVTNPSTKGTLNTLKFWCHQQNHFPQITDDGMLEHVLIKHSYNLELAKEDLENYFTLRHVYRKFYGPQNGHFQPHLENFITLPLPKPTLSKDRVIFISLQDPILGHFDYDRAISQIALTMEYLYWNDNVSNILFVVECTNFTIDHMRLATFSQLAVIIDMVQRVYSNKLTGIIYVNSKWYIKPEIDMLEKLLDPEAFKGVKEFKGIEGLYGTRLTRDCLPKEYGGDLPSIQILLKQWSRTFKEAVPFFDKCYHLVSDESKRIPMANPDHINTGSYFKLQSAL